MGVVSFQTQNSCILIPCYNEAEVLTATLLELKNYSLNAKILVCDDGSSDDSARIARACGAEVLQLPHRGLGATIRAGLQKALEYQADFIVTLDADGQYHPKGIAALLEPLHTGQADVSLGQRDQSSLEQRTRIRRIFHSVSTLAMRLATKIPLHDAGTGFRAYTRAIAAKLEIESDYDHTAETLIQLRKVRVALIPIEARFTLRASKLVTNSFIHAIKEVSLFIKALWRYGMP